MKVTNWDTWQTFRKDRGTPPWIKIHRNLMTNQEWVELTDSEKGQLVSMWILAADKGGSLPDNPRIIQRMAMLDDPPNIQRFIDLGFMTTTCQPDDNQVATTGPQPDQPEEVREDTEKKERKKTAPRKRGTPLPDDWKPSQKDIEYCKTKRPDLNWEVVAENFRDYWTSKAGAGAVKLKWDATWRTWVRKENTPTNGVQQNQPKKKIKITDAMVNKLAKKYGEHGEYHVRNCIGSTTFTSEQAMIDHVKIMMVGTEL